MAGVKNFIYTRPTYLLSGGKQNKAILEHFATEWNEYSQPKRYAEKRLEMARFEQMLVELQEGDTIFVYNPAIFGIGVEAVIENIGQVLAKGVRIQSVLFGEISEAWVHQVQVVGNIIKESCEIEREEEVCSKRGRRQSIGYFEDGEWHDGVKSYATPRWAWERQHKVKVAHDMRESPAVRWIDIKILDGWTTRHIWEEYRVLCKVLPSESWPRVGQQWINTRRLELIK